MDTADPRGRRVSGLSGRVRCPCAGLRRRWADAGTNPAGASPARDHARARPRAALPRAFLDLGTVLTAPACAEGDGLGAGSVHPARPRSCAGTVTSSPASGITRADDGQGDRPPGPRSRRWSSGWRGRTRPGDTGESRVSWRDSGTRSRRPRYGRSCTPQATIPRRGGPGRPGGSSSPPTRTPSSPVLPSASSHPARSRPKIFSQVPSSEQLRCRL